MFLLLAGLALLVSIILLFWLKDRFESPLLARIAYSEIVARLAVIGAAVAIIGGLMILGDLFGIGPSATISR